MLLRDLDSKTSNPVIILMQSSSVALIMLIQDKIKRRFKCKGESIIVIESKSDFKRVREIQGITPPFADRWYVEINVDKFGGKELYDIVDNSSTCVFFCVSDKYKSYKETKNALGKSIGFYDFYIMYLKRADLLYLYDGFVREDNKLSKQLFDYVAQSYSGDVDAVMELFQRLASGDEFKSRKEIADVCGIGNNSVESFIFSLITELSGSDKGLKKVISNRVKAGVDLMESLGATKMYNFMKSCIKSFCDLKELLISGRIYKTIRNLPSGYDPKLTKYQKYLWRIKQIPMSEFMRLTVAMGDTVWVSQIDLMKFIYTYYNTKTLNLLKGCVQNGSIS